MRRLLLLYVAAIAAWAQKLTPVDELGYQALLKSKGGRVVLVDFWATWCAPCRKEMPALAALESKLRSSGFTLITVSTDEPEQEGDAAQFLKESGITAVAYVKRARDDDRFIQSVDAAWSGALPALFLYDRTGKKVKSFIGETEPLAIEAAIRQQLR